MRERFYSTAELARICSVSISTIKRWTDSGLLRCVRTPGGHRKFRVQDVAEAARRLGTTTVEAASEPQPSAEIDELALLLMRHDREALVARLAETLEVGDAAASRRLVIDLHRHGMQLSQIAEQVLLGALEALVQRNGQVDDFVRRRAERLAESCVQHLAALLPPAGEDAPVALVASASGISGTLAPELSELMLRELGWDVVNLGCGVAIQTLQRGLGRVLPALVVVLDAPADQGDLAALGGAAQGYGAELVSVTSREGVHETLRRLRERARERERVLDMSVV